MDSLTQAALGAAVYGAGMGRYQKRKALFIGAFLGTLPDLDVLIAQPDPISEMTYHRGFSHSLFVLTALAWLAAWLVFKKNPQRAYTFRRLFLSIFLALITHPLIDAMTMYGTQLLWPFTPPPVSWATVFIIDPVYTLPLIIACAYAFIKNCQGRAVPYLYAAVLFGCAYFGTGFVGKHIHEGRVLSRLAAEGITVERTISNPTPFNTLLWRVLAQDSEGNVYEAYSGYFDRRAPEYVKKPMNTRLRDTVWQDAPLLRRLDWFTDGWLAYERINGKLVVSDLRMGYAGRKNANPFVFTVAREENGRWQTVHPEHFHSGKISIPEGAAAQLWRRILGHNSLLD